MNSLLQLFFFFVITVLYFFVFKTNMTMPADINVLATAKENLEAAEANYQTYNSNNIYGLLFYFIFVLIVQVIFNVMSVSEMCGGSMTENLGAGFLLAFIPWFLLFGAVIVMIMVFPALKLVFSNVIGYFCISYQAHNILTDILIDSSTDELIKSEKLTGDDDKKMRETAYALLKICGNKSILINEFNPINFNNIWTSIQPLIQTGKYTSANKQKLFDIVIMKDNIGEMMWYFYTAVFLTSIVGYNTVARGCSRSLNSMKQASKDYEANAAVIENKKASMNQVYSVSK